MEAKINIAEILKDKPANTKLYSPLFSEVYFSQVIGYSINVKHHGVTSVFYSSGRFYDYNGSEPLLFPSKEMRDWEKFAWGKGDVLVSNDGKREVLFKTWVNDSYTKFVGLHCLIINDNEEVEYDNGTTVFNTNDFKGIEVEDAVQAYINTIEERLGGKLNRETLEIEKAQPEFKDGDIITIMPHIGDKLIYLFKAEDDEKYYGHAFLDGNIAIVNDDSYCQKDFCTARPSTEEEKRQLLEALAKKGKAWDAEKKAIVDLNPKVELKPFDKVWVKDNPYGSWEPALFWKRVNAKDLHPYMVIGGKRYRFCEPYEGNEHFLDE